MPAPARVLVVLLALGVDPVGCAEAPRHEKPRPSPSAAPPHPSHHPKAPGPAHATSGSVHPDVVHIFPGEKFAVTGTVEGTKLVHLRRVDPPPPAGTKDTLTIELHADGTKLDTASTFAKTVKFQAEMAVSDRPAPLKTSTCPVRAGLTTFESWPRPVKSVFMRDFRLIPDGTRVPCD